jgi:DNA-binding transcriptional regulator GbsR (MarR family)
MEYQRMFKVRDLRKKEKFVMDDAYLNGYAKLCKPHGTCVYMSLCRHADKEQESWPSIERIADEHGISRWSVMRGIKELERWNIVKKIKEKDEKTKRQLNNIYVLIDKSEWVSAPDGRVAVSNAENSKAEFVPATRENGSRVAENLQSRVARLNCKETQNEGNTEYAAQTVAGDIDRFDFNAKLREMQKDKRRHIQIIALYWKAKGMSHENEKQHQAAIKRECRAACNLVGYDDARIQKVIDWLAQKFNSAWKLETIHKYIDEPDLSKAELIKKKKMYYQGLEVRESNGKKFVIKNGEWFDFGGKESEITRE